MTDQLRKRAPRRDSDRGAVVMIVALSMGVLITFTAFSIDLGRQMVKKRDAQAIADVVALDLSRLLDGHTPSWFNPGGAFNPQFAQAKNQSAARNHVGTATVTAEAGQYGASGGWQVNNGQPATAVRVTVSDSVSYYFAPGSGNVNRNAVAAAQQVGTGCFSIGSFALNLNSASSPILGALLGNALNLSAVSYSGLATAQVTLGDLIDAGLAAGTPTQVLNSSVTLADFTMATAQALRNKGDFVNAAILEGAITGTATTLPPIRIGDLIAVEQGAMDAALAAPINVFDLVSGAVVLANGSSAVATVLNGNFLGLISLRLTASVIQGPVIHCAPVGAGSVQTSQVTLHVETGLLFGLLRATIDLTAANGSARTTAISCDASGKHMTVGVTTSLLTMTTAVTLVVPLGTIVSPQPATQQAVVFNVPPDVLGETVKTAGGTGTVGLQTLGGSGVLGLLGALASPLLQVLDPVLGTLLNLLGIRVAGADVVAHDITCATGGPRLVQ